MNNDMMRRIMTRDYARGGRGRSRDYARNEDYARGRVGNDYRDMPQMYSNEYAMGGRVYDSNSRNRFTPRGFDSRSESDYGYSNPASSESDYARGSDMAMRNRRYDGHYGYPTYPFEIAGRVGREYPVFDYGMPEEAYLSEHELKEWSKRLLREVDEKDKAMLEKEAVLHKAEMLGIEFKKFTKEEFYVAVLMMYTDFCKTLGTANFDIYLKLAKDWLCDDDIAIKYSEKLATYYDTIVEGM